MTEPLVTIAVPSFNQYKRTVTNKKLMSLNPSFEFTPLPQAIKESVEWFKENMATARL